MMTLTIIITTWITYKRYFLVFDKIVQKMVWGPGYDNLTVAITISSSSWASFSQLPDPSSQNSMFWIFIWHFEFLCLLCSGNNKARQSVIEKRRGINSKLLFWAYIGENSNMRGNDGHLCLFRRSKTAILIIWRFWILIFEEISLLKISKKSKFRATQMVKMADLGLQNDQNWFHVKSEWGISPVIPN